MFLLRRLLSARWLWPALAVLAACVPFAGGFSLTKIFYIRDLTMFFWPRHLWIHRSLMAGSFPLWDPYAAAGQASYTDALNQLFLPPVLALRTLFPAELGFNLIVLLPFPLAALGTWLFLGRHFSVVSATVGAIVFAASGAVVSTGNFPNLSWSVAWIPWLLWAVDRDHEVRSRRSFSVVALLFAFEMLSGEPVTMAGTIGLLIAYVVASSDQASGVERARAAIRVAAAIAVAGLLAAVQLVPMSLAARASPRGLMQTDNFWSLHPLWLMESMLPHVFGHPYYAYESQLPWLRPLNSGRDPFFYSLYTGPVVLLLSCLGVFGGPRRWRFFWVAVAATALILSFGDYAPVYPALQQVVPPLRSLRFPVKFFLFASLGLAMLAANGAEVLQRSSRPSTGSSRAIRATMGVAVVVALGLVALTLLVLVAPFTSARAFYELGVKVGVADPIAAAEHLFRSLPAIAARALILLLVSAALAYFGSRTTREAWIARTLLFGLAAIELISVNVDVNPVLLASKLGPPAWTAALAAHPAERFYFGGKFRGTLAQSDIDLRGIEWRPPQGVTVEEGRMLMNANMAMTPAAWGVRELISYDLPRLWPVEHASAEYLFEHADREERWRFLARGGVRYCALAAPPGAAVPLRLVGDQFGPMAVYECVPDARRAYVVPNASVVPNVTAQITRLFDPAFDADSTVMLERPAPDAAGSPGDAAPPSAHITNDGNHNVSIAAAAGRGGGYLVLLDSFDPFWRVEVDGRPASPLRANALYRAVRLAPGPHVVSFAYRPTPLYAALPVSGLAALALAWFAVSGSRDF